MLYQEVVKSSVSYKIMEGLFEALFRSYSVSVTGDFVRFMKKRIIDVYNQSDILRLLKSVYSAVRKSTAIMGYIHKNASKNISSILADSAVIKLLKMKI